jgi:hypothetical protein
MAIRKRHKIPKRVAAPAKPAVQQPGAPAPNTNTLPMHAEHLLEDSKNVQRLEAILNQINAYYDAAWDAGNEVLPIFVGLTPAGLLVELSAVRDKSQAGELLNPEDLNVFTYDIGTESGTDIKPREIAEVNMIKGQEQIRLQSEELPMPDTKDGKALAKWRFIDAETIQLRTMGIYEIQPENYAELSFGHGVKALGGTEDSIIPLQHFAGEIK